MKATVTSVLFVLFAIHFAKAETPAIYHPDELFALADLVCIVQVDSITQGSSESIQIASATVVQVWKGTNVDHLTFRANPQPGYNQIYLEPIPSVVEKAQKVLLFLSKGKDNDFDIVNFGQGILLLQPDYEATTLTFSEYDLMTSVQRSQLTTWSENLTHKRPITVNQFRTFLQKGTLPE